MAGHIVLKICRSDVEADTRNALTELASWIASPLEITMRSQCPTCIPSSQTALAWADTALIELPVGKHLSIIA
eukprot:6687323-Karenia_brevis.AAC.1